LISLRRLGEDGLQATGAVTVIGMLIVGVGKLAGGLAALRAIASVN
jgi:hypothetical protein